MAKKAKKGAKTEEETLLFLQQKAEAEERMLVQSLKDKLQTENTNSAVNLLHLNEGWRSILRQNREAQVHKHVNVLSETSQTQLDGLDHVITCLERDLREAERQSAQVRRLHLQHIERLWAQQEKRLTVLQQHWEKNLQHLSAGLHTERKQMLDLSRQQRADLEDAKFTVEQQHKEVMDEIQRLYSQSTASLQSDHEHRMNALVREGEMAMTDRTRHHQEGLHLHRREGKELDELVVKNQEYVRMRDKSMENIKELQDKVFQFRVKQNSGKAGQETMEQDLTAATGDVNQKSRKLRDQQTRDRAGSRRRIVNLTAQFHDATRRLQAVVAKGERILRVAEMCRKQENVFTTSAEDDQRSVTEEEAAEEACEFADIRQATRRFNGALLQRAALTRRREELSRENRQLRLLLRQRLEAMAASDHALALDRPLPTVHRAPTAAAPPLESDRRHGPVEAALVVTHAL
ncbi:dynein regulatory complex subunit 2-like [Scophthalmus maximus]|uniref:dynein regulatory complex subunit 2-like n=1 Tax=Scophthalmus maximus TaxID=52904 RepID=UPI001FA8701F|nr:dynein regulatory complex subunit 2-like [Scophthalmus maximus]